MAESAPRGAGTAMEDFAELIARLRAPDGCPWDREQTHLSLRPFLIEESYEVLDALDAEDPARLREELGDLLLQIVLHAQIASEAGDFTLAELIDAIAGKIVRRHPHVFGEVRADTADEVRANWAAIKAEEQATRGEAADPFAGIPSALPALARAQAVQAKAGRSIAAARSEPPASRSGAVGALLWDIVRQADDWGVDAETALRETTARFMAVSEAQAMEEGAPA